MFTHSLNYLSSQTQTTTQTTRTFHLIVPTRADHGGRASLFNFALPLFIISIFINLCYMFHSSHYGSWLYLLLASIGSILLIIEILVLKKESQFLLTASARVHTLTNLIWLIIFESLFFIGCFWMYMETRFQNLNFISLNNNNTLIQPEVVETINLWKIALIENSYMFSFTPYSASTLDLNYFGVYLNLFILLLVSLLLQLTHRNILINR